jgi:hypothetical protein
MAFACLDSREAASSSCTAFGERNLLSLRTIEGRLSNAHSSFWRGSCAFVESTAAPTAGPNENRRQIAYGPKLNRLDEEAEAWR